MQSIDNPTAPAPTPAAAALFAGEGEMRARCRAMDGAATPLGRVERWPATLRWTVRPAMDSPFPINLWCGPELVLIYTTAPGTSWTRRTARDTTSPSATTGGGSRRSTTSASSPSFRPPRRATGWREQGSAFPIVNKMVESRGGRVWVESAPGEGAAFHVLWPARPAEENEK